VGNQTSDIQASFAARIGNIPDFRIDHGRDSEFLCMLDEALDCGIAVLDENFNYRYMNQGMFKQLGLDEGTIKIGDSLKDCHKLMIREGLLTQEIITQNKISVQETTQAQAHAQVGKSTTFNLHMANGSTYKLIRTKLANGYTVSVSYDITDLLEKESMLNEALALGNSGYWMYDFTTKTYTFSNTLKSYFQPDTLENIKSKGIFYIIHPEDRDQFRQLLTKISYKNRKFNLICRPYNNILGSNRWCQTIGEIMFDTTGKPSHIRAFVKDITKERHQAHELERAKDEAIAASRAKSAFLANMSHEIRTPMNGVLGMAELLANTDIDDRQREYIKVITRSSTSLLLIINDILDFSKIEANALELDPQPFDFKNAVDDVIIMLSSSAAEKSIELIIHYPEGLPQNFIGDVGRIRQILTNLVGNAIKFTEKGHVLMDVSIENSRDDIDMVTIKVADTGIGIAPQKLNDIFDKFTQADNSTTRIYGGTGLGLAISKHLVEMMHGRITVDSQIGEGSTFTITLPLKRDMNTQPTLYDTQVLAGKRALIIDDIDINNQILSDRLNHWGMHTQCTNTGIEALALLEKGEQFDIIIVDHLMPDMTGQDMMEIMTNTPDLPKIPAIMLSSCDQALKSEDLTKIGIYKHHVKPIREHQFYDCLVETLSQSIKAPSLAPHDAQPIELMTTADKTEILVAEDIYLNQDVIRLMLSDTEFSPIFAVNGQEAIDLFQNNIGRFAAILMDISMPVMDGYQAAREIAIFERNNQLPHTPIIALTGHALKEDRQICLDRGMDGYLTKPVKQKQLLDYLNHYISGDQTKIKSLTA